MQKPTVHLHDYNPKWEVQYEYEKDRIVEVIGDKVIAIQHIGSTSIRGMQAKPIIDIMIGVHELAEVTHFIAPLSKIEYEYVPKPEFTERKFFRKGRWGKGTCHLHICKFNSNEWMEKLLFRDYLRTHSQVADEYATLKQELASNYQFDRATYTKKKEPFIQAIIKKAKLELRRE
ncbi:GrpB family protein [Metabacillus malikii]|uniref:GrpB-like predicted nucleotidyltransferase (UPF0157 family) n=1 Tax=Metabacillus malikii TaxID=1504265 RepID=A0ABT9ZM38_9BACI|nr:GrpB family protein [Metabacillus malikii]MDQ0233324.1 GrpB-like predicted nucleotidyltransferase (UPF0157 family) [Metabacillus malikii]